MRNRIPTSAFARDLKKIQKRGTDMMPLYDSIELLRKNGRLPPSYRPHKLHGEWLGFWECHVAHDWLLMYIISDTEIILYRTGSHSDIFKK